MASSSRIISPKYDKKDQLDRRKENVPVKKSLRSKIGPVNVPKNLFGVLPADQIESLFVEMCFFARLGFVQPPCCLQCAFNESRGVHSSHSVDGKLQNINSNKCTKLVVWRFNAGTVFHPGKLEKNVVLVTCHTAQAWLRGEAVLNLWWDPKSKRLESTKSKS